MFWCPSSPSWGFYKNLQWNYDWGCRNFKFTFEKRDALPDVDRSFADKLSQDHFEKIERSTNESEDYEVWNNEGSTAVLVGHIRKPPNVSQAYWERDAWQNEFSFGPSLSFRTWRIIRYDFLVFQFGRLLKNKNWRISLVSFFCILS